MRLSRAGEFYGVRRLAAALRSDETLELRAGEGGQRVWQEEGNEVGLETAKAAARRVERGGIGNCESGGKAPHSQRGLR